MAGPNPISKRDWPFGARNRRRLLEVVLGDEPPANGWTATDLALAIGASPHGSLDRHLAGLCQWGILERTDAGRFVPATPMVELGRQLRELLSIVEAEPDEPLQELDRRSYGRS